MVHTEFILAAIILTPMLVLSGLVSGSETALFGISHAGRTRLANASPAAADSVAALLKYPRHLLTALLALNNLINVTYFSVSSILVVSLERSGAPAAAAALGIGSLIAVILVGEIAAKLLANARTIAFCRFVAIPWILIIRLGWPLWSTLDKAVLRPLVRLASTRPTGKEAPTADDLAAVLAAADAAANTDATATDQRLLAQIINLRERRVRHAMRPRVETPALAINAPAERIDAEFQQHDAIIVTDQSGHPLGWLGAVAFLSQDAPTDPARRKRLVDTPMFIPELASLDAALRQLRAKARDRAIVVDERGEFEGTIHIEDIVATLIADAADQPADTDAQPQLVGLGVFSIPGRWPAHALLKDLDLAHEHVDQILAKVSTVGGLALALLGRVPEEGDTLELPGATLTVTGTEGRVVTRVEVRFHNVIQPEPDQDQ